MNVAAALVYWVVVAIWLVVLATVVFFYLRNPRGFGTTRLLLAVLTVDTFRNIVENIYFGLYFGGRYGLFDERLVDILGHPVLILVPKLLNVAAGCLVLSILLLRWFPAAVRERGDAERYSDALSVLATTDGMTGLFNRRHFLALAETEWNRFQRYGQPLSMLLLDIDMFKTINDRYGHDAGDRMIIEIAALCRAHSRASDIIGRLGGEEFCLLLPETRLDSACDAAERLRESVARLKLTERDEAVTATVSIGVAEASGGDTLSILLKQADEALYEAKRTGRNRVCLFASSGLHRSHGDRGVAAVPIAASAGLTS
jgi:diguanylate cyclase (GGDEF)-like protein